MGLCPFPDHKESIPSFSVRDNDQVFYCFGCKRGGNVYTFLQHFQGLSFPDAIEHLAARASITLPRREDEDVEAARKAGERRRKLLKTNKFSAVHFYKSLQKLPQTHPAQRYLKERGLSSETVDTFKIGYCSEDWSNLAEYLEERRVPMDLAEELGLVKPRKKEGTGYFDVFRSRLIFPIISPAGDVIGFGGRQLGDGHPKYLNSKESTLFSKGRVFYGLNETAKFIRTEQTVVVVEGYMDLLALYQAGIPNVVATLGTALTEDHGRVLTRFSKDIVILFDGDAAGQLAAERSLPILLAAGLLPRAVVLPDGQDPDDYLKGEGVESLKSLIKNAPDLFLVFLNSVMKDYRGQPSDRVRIMDRLAPVLIQIRDSRLTDLYLEEIGGRLGVKREWLLRSLRDSGPAGQRAKVTPSSVPSESKSDQCPSEDGGAGLIKISRPTHEEYMLLTMSLLKEDYLKEVLGAEIIDKMSESGVDRIFSMIAETYGQDVQSFDRLGALLASKIDDPSIVTGYIAHNESSPDEGKRIVVDCIKRVRERHLRGQSAALVNELRTNTDREKLEQFMNIVKDRHAEK
jgi:DNA primase